VTHVVRGADLLASTPRQIFLQRRLRYPEPSYLHVPVAINAAGDKLSKQTGAEALPADPGPALLAAWRFLGQDWPDPASEPVRAGDFWAAALPRWNASRLPPTAMLPAPWRIAGGEAGKV
jgi:glutamyl-Q tRNA(Asp) synthetase